MKNFNLFFILLLVAFFSFAAMAQVPTSGLQLWLKADAGVTLNGSTVSQWTDQSGNGNNALQSNSDRQPMFIDNEINNKPVLHFDGVNDRLELYGTSTMSQISLFLVFKIDSGLVGNEGTDPLPYFPIVLGNPNLINAYGLSMRNFFSENSPNIIDPWLSADSWVQAEAPNIAAFDQWKVLSVVTNQTMWNTTVRSNGVDAVITPEGTANTPLSVPLGTPEGISGIGGADNVPAGHLIFKGDIAEVIIYDTVLSESEKDSVENYLADKYNISTPIPTAGLQLWLKADEGVTLNGSTVSQWTDQSGNGNNVIQPSADRQPLLVANELNNKPVLRFDGFNDMLGLTGTQTMSQISLFMVYKVDSGATGPNPNCPLVLGDANIAGQAYGLTMQPAEFTPTANELAIWTASDAWLLASLTDITKYGEWKNLSSVTNQTIHNTTVHSNGQEADILPQGSDMGISFSLGNAGGPGYGGGIGGADDTPSPPSNKLIFKGDIAEIIIYDTVLTASERLAVENYLSYKYNISVTTGIEDSQGEIIPERFSLSQNYPNPFNPSTNIQFEVPNSSFVTLKVYDILGREVASLVNEEKSQGRYSVNFDASRLASGVYIYQIRANDYVSAKTMMLLK